MTPEPIDIAERFAALGFLANRTADEEQVNGDTDEPSWMDTLSAYRDGGIFIVHYAGQSAWERHPADEVVMVVDGATTITLDIDRVHHHVPLTAMQLIVVPANTWHMFDTPDGVRALSTTPQPTEHKLDQQTETSVPLKA